MEYLPNGYTLEIPKGAFPLSTDSIVLAHFVRLRPGAKVLDLASGCAALGLMLCAREERCSVTGVELDPAAHEAALSNIAANGLGHRLSSLCQDLRTVPDTIPCGSFSVCISNPPYFSAGPTSATFPTARHDGQCSAAELFRSAAWALKYGGDFFLVHKPERLAELIGQGQRNGMEAKRLGLVRHREGGPVSLILLQFRKGAKPGLKWEEYTLFDSLGNPTQDYRTIYHIEEA